MILGHDKQAVNVAAAAVVAQLHAQGLPTHEVVEAKDLSRRLTSLHAEKPNAKLVVLADTSAAHGRVVWVMQVARFAGFQQLAIGTQSGPK